MPANSRGRVSLRWLARLGSAAFGNEHTKGSPRGRGGPGRCGKAPGGCYLFLHWVNPQTCARIRAGRRSLPLAPAGRGREESAGLGSPAVATGKPSASPSPGRRGLRSLQGGGEGRGAGSGEDTQTFRCGRNGNGCVEVEKSELLFLY